MYRKVLGCLSFVIGVAFASEAYPPTNYIIQGQYVTVDGQKLWAEKYGAGQPVSRDQKARLYGESSSVSFF